MIIKKCLSKKDIQKIRKFEKALEELQEELQEGKTPYFSITKLISMKSLCKDSYYAKEFCLYIALLIGDKIKLSSSPEDKKGWDYLKQLSARAVDLITKYHADPTKENNEALRNILPELKNFQNEYKKIKWTTVRMIRSRDILIMEQIVQCLLASESAAPAWTYEIAKNYVETYNSRYGAGLIPDSIPMLRDVISFWRQFCCLIVPNNASGQGFRQK